MAEIKNISKDTLSLFHADAPPVTAGDTVTVRDENFVNRAWPTSTWELVEAPVLEGELSGYVDQSTDEAILWAEPLPEIEGVLVQSDIAGTGLAINADTGEVTVGGKVLDDLTVPELKAIAEAADIDVPARAPKAELIAAIAAHTKED